MKLLLICLIATLPLIASAGEDSVPQHFKATVGSVAGRNYIVELKDGSLVYTLSDAGNAHPRSMTITPTTTEWKSFTQTLDALNIWIWQTNYTNGVDNGTHWTLDIAYAGHALKTQGVNCYPDMDGKPVNTPKATPTFESFQKAVESLVGGKVFRAK